MSARVHYWVSLIVVGMLWLFASLSAHAYNEGDYGIRSEYSANRTINTATHHVKGSTVQVTTNGVTIGRDFTMKAPGGRTAAAQATAAISKDLALKWGARALAGASAVGTAMLLYDIYDALRVRENPAGEGLLFDPGTDEVVTPNAVCHFIPGMGETLQSVCRSQSDATNTWGQNRCVHYGGSTASVNSITIVGTPSYTAANGSVTFHVSCSALQGNPPTPYTFNVWSIDVQWGKRTTTQCPMVDGEIPAVGADGKCPTGLYTQAIEPDVAAQMAADKNAACGGGNCMLSDPQWQDLVEEALGEMPHPITQDSYVQVGNVVPSHIDGPTTTTTGPAGTVEEAIAWDFEPYGITKPWQERLSGAWDETKTKTTKDVNGNVISTETTTVEGAEPGDIDKCADGATTIGCMSAGDMPTDTVPTSTQAVNWSAESLGLPSGCPADVTLPNGNVLSYAQTCEAFDDMKPLIIALGAFSAAMMVVFALRGQ